MFLDDDCSSDEISDIAFSTKDQKHTDTVSIVESSSTCSITPKTKRHKNQGNECSIGSSVSTSFMTPTLPKTKKKSVSKDLDDVIPLPSPFPLPKHFSFDVEFGLQEKKMTRETTSKFITAVAGAMLNYKRYPSSDDYQNVARTIINKYPHLKSPTGSPHVSCFCINFIS